MISYGDFLNSKIAIAPTRGIAECRGEDFNKLLKPHQRDLAQWCVRGGTRGVFAAFGLAGIELENKDKQ